MGLLRDTKLLLMYFFKNKSITECKSLISLPSHCICLFSCFNFCVKKLMFSPAALHVGLLTIKRNFAHGLRLMQLTPHQKLACPEEIKTYVQRGQMDCQGLTGTSQPDLRQ